MIQSHSQQNSEHYKLLKTNLFYRQDFINDCLREEMMMNMPIQQVSLPAITSIIETEWSKKQWSYVLQLKAQILHLQNKVVELSKSKKPKKKYLYE
jgi:hypothetical protein